MIAVGEATDEQLVHVADLDRLEVEQIDAVITYLQARIIGRGRITKQECLAYYEDRPDECDDIN